MASLLEILRTCAWIVLAAALAVLCRLQLKDVDVRRMKSLALLRLPASVRWALAVLALAGFFVAGGKPGGTNGNRISATENSSTRAYTANVLNQYTSIASAPRIGDRCLTPVANPVVPIAGGRWGRASGSSV